MKARRIVGPVVSYLVFCLVLGICFGELTFHPPRLPVADRKSFQATAALYGAVLQDVSVAASDGVVLRGWFARPASRNGDAVLLLHGLGNNRQQMTGFAELFLSKGYEVLLPDLRSHGTSGGNFPTYGVVEADDVQQWFRWLVTQQRPSCVFALGESMGAAIVLQAVRVTPFCGVVAECSYASFRQFAYIRVGQWFHAGSWLGRIVLRPIVEVALVYGNVTRGVDLSQASPQDSVAQSTVPILLIHGLADNNIPAHQSEMIRSHNPADVTLWEVPKAGHCGAANAEGDQFARRVLGWFSSRGDSTSHRSAL